MPELTLDGLKTGLECYAWQYDWLPGLSKPLMAMKPARGVLAAQPDQIGNIARGPGWFVPYGKNSKRPAFTKATRVEAVKLYTDKTEAEDAYNNAVRAVAARFFNLASMVQDDLVQAKRDGFSDGALENYPVLRPDLSLDYTGIATAAKPVLELLPDHGGDIMSWSEFDTMLSSGAINAHDGIAALRLDGKGCENAIVDIWSGLVYIADKYAIPFKMAPAAFFGHDPEIHWFRK